MTSIELHTLTSKKIHAKIMETKDEGGYIDLTGDVNNFLRISNSKLCLGIQENLDDLDEMF